MKPMLMFALGAMALDIVGTANAQNPYIPYRTDQAFTLDGQLAEADWHKCVFETDFMQQGPEPGAKATERTACALMYDNDYLYVAVIAYDSEPDKMIRTELQRDFPLGNDDGNGITIDTYNDKLTGMSFVSNTLNARWDAQVTRDGAGLATSFNTFWDTRTTLNDSGYVTEYRIPFSTLRFEESEQVMMRFRVARLIKRKNELISYPPCDPATENIWSNVSFAREVVFTGLKGGHPFYVAPYVIANYYELNALNADATAYEKSVVFMNRKQFVNNEALDKIISNLGLDVKYGLSKNMTLDLTLNTDFAQAEVDDRIINLTKYEVNLPERRLFFLESANALSFGFPSGNELFITRRIGRENGEIVPIIGGARLTGKANGWLTGALNMQTMGIITETDTITPHNFTVVRTRKDIDSLGSFVGGIIAHRIDTDSSGRSFQSMGLDFVKRVNQQFTVEGGFAGTMEDLTATALDSNYYAHLGVFKSAREGLTYGTTIDFVGPGMDPVMGFLDDQNYSNAFGYMTYQWNLDEMPVLQFFNLYAEGNYRQRLESGRQETLRGAFGGGVYFENGATFELTVLEFKEDSLFFDWELDEDNAISAGNYRMYNSYVGITLPTQSTYFVAVGGSYGGFFGGLRSSANAEMQYYVNSHLNASLIYEFNDIRFEKYLTVDEQTRYVTNLVRLGLNYNFSTKVSLKAYIQFDDLSYMTSANVRFRYNPQEGTDLFIVLNEGINNDRDRLDPRLPYINSQAITAKFIKTFAL